MALRTQYLDREKNGRANLETLHRAIRDKDLEIEILDAELRKANSDLVFAKKMVLQKNEANVRSEREHKAQELKSHVQYMEAIKTIERLKREVRCSHIFERNASRNARDVDQGCLRLSRVPVGR